MNNEYLEALKRIKNKFIDFFHEDSPDVECIEDALLELKEIENSKPSEALKWLEKYKPTILFNTNVVEQALIKAQEMEKENDEYKQLEKQLGCPLNLVLNLIKNSNKLDKHCHTQDIWFEYEGQVICGSFLKLGFEDNKFVFYIEASLPNSSYDLETTILYVKDYKKNWWLKEDKSE